MLSNKCLFFILFLCFSNMHSMESDQTKNKDTLIKVNSTHLSKKVSQQPSCMQWLLSSVKKNPGKSVGLIIAGTGVAMFLTGVGLTVASSTDETSEGSLSKQSDH